MKKKNGLLVSSEAFMSAKRWSYGMANSNLLKELWKKEEEGGGMAKGRKMKAREEGRRKKEVKLG